ncbi:hypothetical protein GCM10023317_44210 [Actinopolymorpha pittospori]
MAAAACDLPIHARTGGPEEWAASRARFVRSLEVVEKARVRVDGAAGAPKPRARAGGPDLRRLYRLYHPWDDRLGPPPQRAEPMRGD